MQWRRWRHLVGHGTLKDLRARLLQIVLDREGQLLDVGEPARTAELRRQLQILRKTLDLWD
jgi:hypothetical protein